LTEPELDFYIKKEVVNLDEMERAGEDLAEGWFQLARLIKRVGGYIIEFLAQIEEFQKVLWEKKKFVTEAFVLTRGTFRKTSTPKPPPSGRPRREHRPFPLEVASPWAPCPAPC